MIWMLPLAAQAPHAYHLKPRRGGDVKVGAGVGSRTQRFTGYEPVKPPMLHPRQGEDTTALNREHHLRLDELERRILDELPPVHMPVIHRFMPGLYVREISMPEGTLLTSKIHKTEHPYTVLEGRAMVLVAGEEPVLLEAGHIGITRAMTRRALYIPGPGPCRWSTAHVLSTTEEEMRQNGASDQELLDMIEARIIEPRLHLDGANAHQEYLSALQAAGLPGPHDGPRALEDGE